MHRFIHVDYVRLYEYTNTERKTEGSNGQSPRYGLVWRERERERDGCGAVLFITRSLDESEKHRGERERVGEVSSE